ncbi:MAG: tRNA threonylcarbamoyladenosine dehydratase [Treponema sp.]|nr:tRNA threonylcarbamoyladenosine dehydratase [Treponema sp.]
MLNQFSRTELLLGTEALRTIQNSRVIVFGVGGVGGYVVEALVRSGITHIDIVDNDTVSLTNINRQIIATHSSIGKAKVEVMRDRILDINPDAKVTIHQCFYLPENKNQFDFTQYDYVIDAVDTVSAKIALIQQAKEAGTKIISCMGAGNKLDPTKFQIADISKTSVCPLARVMRQECKKRHITKVKVLFSTEKPVPSHITEESEKKGNGPAPGSIAFVPSVAGLIIAAEVIKDLSAR